jgi:Uma2 family endonuclease
MTTRATTIVYPETDGMPLPDGDFQSPLFRRIVGDLDDHFCDVPGAKVNGDTFIYYVEGNPRRSVSPDCYVALGLSAEALESFERNNAYRLWEVGKAPDFVLEIGSESTADADLGRKRELYAELGVSEYWRYDATGGEFYGEPLVGEYLLDGEYRRFELRHESDGRVWSHSEVLNLDIWWMEDDLRFWDPVGGDWLLRREEERVGRLEERSRAEAAKTHAEEERVGRLEERSRAEIAETRVLELEAELRRLREE